MIKKLEFNAGHNDNYIYYPLSGVLCRKNPKKNECPSDIPILTVYEFSRQHLVYLLDIDKESAIKLLKDILKIYNRGKEVGSYSKQKEIRKALGINEDIIDE